MPSQPDIRVITPNANGAKGGCPRRHHVTEKRCIGCGQPFTMVDRGIKFPSQFAKITYCSNRCRLFYKPRIPGIHTVAALRKALRENSVQLEADGCALWTGPRGRRGYGRLKAFGKNISAHRAAYELNYGPIPSGLVILHSCDTPACINPKHLSVGTQSDNMRDCVRKGRHNLQSHNRGKFRSRERRGSNMAPADNL